MQMLEFYLGSKKSKIKKFYFPEEYRKTDTQNEYDYAILILEEDLGSKLGFFGVSSSEVIDANMDFYLYGYCSDDEILYGMHNKGIELCSGDILAYDSIDTSPGQSGSPIFFKDSEENCYIVGIHVRYCSKTNKNEGIYINRKRHENIARWLKNDYQFEISSRYTTRELSLSGLQVGKYGMIYLSKLNVSNLQDLGLDNNNIGDEGVSKFSMIKLPFLKRLSLHSNNITSSGLESLLSNRFLELSSLSLSANRVGDKGVKLFLGKDLPNLEILNLSSNEISTTGAECIKDLFFPNLKKIYLCANSICDKVFESLKEFKSPLLKYLNLSWNIVSDIEKTVLFGRLGLIIELEGTNDTPD